MILMFNVTAPLNKGVEVTKTFLKTVETSPPPYLRSRGVYTTYSEEGYRWYNIVEIDDVHIHEGFTELMKRTVPFDSIEGLKINMEILTPMRAAVEVVYPDRVTTGDKDLDDMLLGGIPEKYAVLLASPPCDERDLLVKKFLEAGMKNDEVVFYITIDPGKDRALIEKISNLYLIICNPQADKIFKDSPHVCKLKGIENLNDISIALTTAFRKLTKKPRRICIEIISDVLLHHHAVKTRKWLTTLIPDLRLNGFTTLAIVDPGMHTQQEVRAITDLFEGEMTITERKTKKGFERSLIIKKMHAQRYLEDELPLKKGTL